MPTDFDGRDGVCVAFGRGGDVCVVAALERGGVVSVLVAFDRWAEVCIAFALDGTSSLLDRARDGLVANVDDASPSWDPVGRGVSAVLGVTS